MTTREAKLFIQLAWEEGTFEAMKARMGLDRRAASNAAAHLRRLGIVLPRLRAGEAWKMSRKFSAAEVDALRVWSQNCQAAALARKYRVTAAASSGAASGAASPDAAAAIPSAAAVARCASPQTGPA